MVVVVVTVVAAVVVVVVVGGDGILIRMHVWFALQTISRAVVSGLGLRQDLAPRDVEGVPSHAAEDPIQDEKKTTKKNASKKSPQKASKLQARAAPGVLPDAHSKAVLLGYLEGGENWSHQDDNTNYAYQALLLLSEPQVDFTGGGLYVLDGSRGFEQTAVEFGARGDVVVFRSNGDYFHGMQTVCKGSAEHCSRIAVGLLHPKK